MKPVTGYFIGQLSKGYKLHEVSFTSYSLFELIDFVKPRGGTIWDENKNILYQFPFNIEHWINHPEEHSYLNL